MHEHGGRHTDHFSRCRDSASRIPTDASNSSARSGCGLSAAPDYAAFLSDFQLGSS